MIIGLKANVAEIAMTYQTAYPNARILFADEKSFKAENRVAFFNQIKNNDYDCVRMTGSARYRSHRRCSRYFRLNLTPLRKILMLSSSRDTTCRAEC